MRIYVTDLEFEAIRAAVKWSIENHPSLNRPTHDVGKLQFMVLRDKLERISRREQGKKASHEKAA